jgi:asparagine synthase (glutamine-hydrolysing)
MCGIAGIINFTETAVDEALLRSMCESIAYRGPDDEGFLLDHNIGLGHKRLSIIDLASGHQPLCNEDESIWIVYNGEVYNYPELRMALIQKGHIFRTHSDTEVILHSYEEFGEDCVNKFNGMFAFVIYDSKKKKIFGARDRFGIKPLYYFIDNDKFLFGSEIKAILKHPEIRAEVNPDGIGDYLAFQFCLGNKTLFDNIFKILPGYSFSLSLKKPKSFKVKQYWDLKYPIDTYHTEDYFIDTLMRLIEDSVRIRLRSDVEIGAHLSGGLDSSTVVSVASTLLGEETRLKTFTGGFRDYDGYDESGFATLVSKHNGTKHYEIFPTATDFVETLPKLIYYMDEPSAGPGLFPQYFVSKLASQKVKVVLGGQGGDEIFGGYARYLVAYLEQCIKGAIFETQEEGKHVVTLDSIVPNLSILQQYTPMLQDFWNTGLFDSMEKRYFRLIYRGSGYKDLICDQYAINESRAFGEFQACFSHADTSSYFNKMGYFDMKASLPALLQVEDRTSMACSLESRLPLLDYRIVELMASVPPTIKYKGGMTKYLIKKAVRNVLPSEVLERKDKMGFPVPLSEWYQDKIHGFVHDTLLSDHARDRKMYNMKKLEDTLFTEKKFGRGVWGMLCLELWYQQFIDTA